MELLVVIVIIVVMAVVAVSATNSSGAAAGSKQGAILASDVLALARSEAVQTQGFSALVVDANPDPDNPGNFLHRLMVADIVSVGNSGPTLPTATGPNNLKQVSTWYYLPEAVYFEPIYSFTSSAAESGNYQNETIPLVIANTGSTGTIFQGAAYVYTFTPTGQLTAAGQFIVAAGHKLAPPSTPVFEDGTSGGLDTREGFYLHLQGRPSFYQSPLAISSTISSH